MRFRLRPVLRFAGPMLVVVGLVGAAAGTVLGAAVVLVGAVASVGLVPMVEVSGEAVRYRGLLRTVVLAVPEITEVRLRRSTLTSRRWPGGRPRRAQQSSHPIRLQVVAGEEALRLRVSCWRHWAELVERLLEVTGIPPDLRTVGRIERYG